MSEYEKPWHVSVGASSSYHRTPEEALARAEHGLSQSLATWVSKGGCEYRDVPGSSTQIGGTIITRTRDEKVLIGTLRCIVERARVQQMIKDLRLKETH